MTAFKDFIVVMASTALVSLVLTLFFDWRSRWLSHVGGDSHEH